MIALFLPVLKARLLADLADLRLDCRTSAASASQKKSACAVRVFIGDLPPKKRGSGDTEVLDDRFPCIVLVPLSGQTDSGEDAVTVALICGVYCGEEGDTEGAETDMILLISRIRQSLIPCLKEPLEARYRLTPDEKGRLFPWEKSDVQPRPYVQATLMTQWRMKGLE